MKNSGSSSSWRIEYPNDIEKEFKKFSRKEKQKIYSKIGELQTLQNPFTHHQVFPLTAELKGKWKLKWGNFRVVFKLNGKRRIIEVELVGRKTEATYRKVIRRAGR